jgi:hypothetical protein
VPRFFADPHRDHEERRAERVGRIARSLRRDSVVTPSLPTTASVATSPSGAALRVTPTAPVAVQRTPDPAMTPAPEPTPPLAAAPTIQRSTTPAAASAPSAPSASATPAPPSATSRIVQRAERADAAADDRPPSATKRLDELEELVALIESRVLAELERRGGRHRGWI